MKKYMIKARPYCRRSMFASICLLLLIFSGSALAQSYDNPGLGQLPVSAHPQDFKPLGVRAGTFMLHPGIELATQWLDNILYTNSHTVSDTIFHIRPYITAQSNWSRHSFNVRLAADIARYNKHDFRDYEDYFFQLGGRVDVAARSAFSYGFDWMQLHEERNIRSAEQGIKPTVFTLLGGNLGYDHTFNRFSIGVLYDLRKLDYKNNINLEGEIIDNNDRDRTRQNIQARFGYQFKADKQLFATLGYDWTNFKQDLDRNGYDRSSNGYHISAGVDFTITSVLSGDLYATYRQRKFDDNLLKDVSGWGGGAGLHWYPTTLTSVHGRIETSIEDTTQATSSGYFRTLYSVRVDHELLRDLQLMAQVSYSHNKYELLAHAPEGSRDKDTYFVVDVGATYFFNRWSWLSASYNYNKFNTNVVNDDFNANQFWLVLGFER